MFPLMSKSPAPFGFPLPGAGGAFGVNGVPAVPTVRVMSQFDDVHATSSSGIESSSYPFALTCPLAVPPFWNPRIVFLAAYSHSLSVGSLYPSASKLHSARSHEAVSEESVITLPLFV